MGKTRIIYLGNQLSASGYTPTSVETLGERLKEKFEVIQASSKKNRVARLIHMWWIILTNKKSDFLLLDTYSTSAFIFAWSSARLAELCKLKYIPILHGGALPDRAKKSPKLLKHLLEHAHHVVCPSPYLKVELENAWGGDYQIIPNFIDIRHYPYQQKIVSKEQGLKLFWLRSFHEIYNPFLAIKILHQLVEKGYHNSELCMAGPDKDGLMNKVRSFAAELGVEDKLKTPGNLSKKDWIQYSKDYNIFINTTNVDNTPVSVMEAMALGFPVVTSKVGGIPYLFEDGKEGIMVEADNCDDFVEAILKIEADPKFAQEIGLSARKKAELWDWSAIKIMWEKILNK